MIPEEELKMEAAVGARQVNIYVEEKLDDIEKTVCVVYYIGEKGKYKHFTYVLAPGKTRITLTDLISGAYEVCGLQMSKNGDMVEGRTEFEFTECSLDLIDYTDEILDSLDRIHKALKAQPRAERKRESED